MVANPRNNKMKASPKAKNIKIADNRAVTSPGMDKELKRLGITIQDLIDSEKKMGGITGSSNKFGPVKL